MTAFSTLIAAKTTAGSLKDWLNNGTIPSEAIVTEAQAQIYRRLRVREMQTIGTATMGTGTEVVGLDAEMLQFYAGRLTITGTHAAVAVLKRLEDVEAQRFYNGSGVLESGKPSIFAIVGTAAHFPCIPDAGYVFRYPFYKTPAALSTATETNFLTQKFPTMLRAMCMAYAYEYLRNPSEYDRWLKIAEARIDQANAESDMSFGGLEMELTVA